MNVDAMIKHHQAVTEVITHAMSDYASAATGTSWNKACFAFEADAILCALSRDGFRILGPDDVDQVTVDKCAEVLRSKSDEASYHAGALAGKLSGKLKGRKQSARWNSQKNHYDKICFYYSKASDAIRALATKEEGDE